MKAGSLSVVAYAEAVACVAALQNLCDEFADTEDGSAARRGAWAAIEREHSVLAALLQDGSG